MFDLMRTINDVPEWAQLLLSIIVGTICAFLIFSRTPSTDEVEASDETRTYAEETPDTGDEAQLKEGVTHRGANGRRTRRLG